MSTRDEILEALSEVPKGLTLKELAEYCMACEHDEQIVGTMIAILQRENVIHSGPELREGASVWIFGKEPVEEYEPPTSLAGADQKPSSAVSEAAQAIARMRQDSPRIRAHAAPTPPGPALTVRAKIEAALRERGPMRATDVAKRVAEKNIGNHCSSLAKRNVLVTLGGNKRGTIYGLPGQTLKDQKADKKQPTKGREPATLSWRGGGGVGGGGAAGPAPVAKPAQEIHAAPARTVARAPVNGHDNLYEAALLDLQERRGAAQVKLEEAQEQVHKFDRAIEAMRALT